MRRHSLPVTLYVVFALSACIGALGVITFRVSVDAFARERSHAERELRAMTEQTRSTEEGSTQPLLMLATRYAADPGVASMDTAQCDASLAGLSNGIDGGYFEVVDGGGRVVCSVFPPGVTPTTPYEVGPWFADALAKAEPSVLPPAPDATLGAPAITVVAPITSSSAPGTAIGAVVIIAGTSYPLDIPSEAPTGSVLVLLDATRSTVLATSANAPVHVGQDLAGTVLGRPLPVGSAITDVDGTRRMYADVQVASNGEHVLAGVPEEAVLAPAKRQVTSTIEIGALTILVVLATGILLQRRLARPLRRVAKAIRANLERDDAGEAPITGPREVAHVAAVFNDLITERRAREAELQALARRDSLTQLPNRTALVEHLTEALARADGVAVAFLDLDRFKNVNDAHGHAVGDQLLVALGQRLAEAHAGAFVSRFGGDEYVIVWTGVADETAACRLADHVAHTLRAPLEAGGHELYLSGSVGVALGEAGETADDVLRNADTAMYRAKEAGRDRYAVFNHSMREWALLRAYTEQDLHAAIGSDQLAVHYQPKFSLADGAPIGAEALLRWTHPARGPVPPSEFIPIAEESGLIVPLGEWVLEEACRQAVQWRAQRNGVPFPIAVNLSAQQLALPDLPDIVARIMEHTGAGPEDIALEVTESAVLTDVERVTARLRTMRDRGIHIAVDDFGTGYSSLSYIQQLPIDEVKIDRCFVAQLPFDETSIEIIGSVIKLAHAIGLSVVAEGVENSSQLVVLDALDCDEAQGFFLCKPADAATIEAEVFGDRGTETRIIVDRAVAPPVELRVS